MDSDRPTSPDTAALGLLRDGAVTDAAQQVRNRLVLARAAYTMQLLPPDPDDLLFWLFTGSAVVPQFPMEDAHFGAERLDLRGSALQLISEAYGSGAVSMKGLRLCVALERWIYAPALEGAQ